VPDVGLGWSERRNGASQGRTSGRLLPEYPPHDVDEVVGQEAITSLDAIELDEASWRGIDDILRTACVRARRTYGAWRSRGPEIERIMAEHPGVGERLRQLTD